MRQSTLDVLTLGKLQRNAAASGEMGRALGIILAILVRYDARTIAECIAKIQRQENEHPNG